MTDWPIGSIEQIIPPWASHYLLWASAITPIQIYIRTRRGFIDDIYIDVVVCIIVTIISLIIPC